MATIKSFTDLSQSKVLANILPIQSADMGYICENFVDEDTGEIVEVQQVILTYIEHSIPCWSLASLLGVFPNYQLQTQDDGIGILCSCNGKFNIVTADNPVDACVAMIEKLHKLNLL